ncbi:MAG: glycogen/starch/alpha-glucan phosphorylase [Tissierellia bacterium]|nr:glycogen/starch/alpha-glucan phosphorylase [Tissierellia bacterium]
MNLLSKDEIIFNLKNTLKSDYAVSLDHAENFEIYNSLVKVVMRLIAPNWEDDSQERFGRTAYYLSSEYLMGRLMSNNLTNLGIEKEIRDSLEEIGLDYNELENIEFDAGLGSGGLGRLAACFLDSAATHHYPLHGYGIRYEYGIFKQEFKDDQQIEKADNWLRYGEPWSIRRESDRKLIDFSDQSVYAVPYDYPIIGYDSKVINTLRLWRSEPIEEFNFGLFNEQHYDMAMQEKNRAEDISRVLYPNDSRREGKILRLKQQYFFTSASIQDLVEKHLNKHESLDNFCKYNSLQLNDTHPAVGVAELLRVFCDVHGMEMDKALEIAQRSFNYTNHTIMNEALEKWEIDLYKEILPRNFQIIQWIDAKRRKEMEELKVEAELIESTAIIKDGLIHMAHLALYGSDKLNGVAQLHSNILKDRVLNDWYRVYPDKFTNVTNGITQRRWLLLSNPELSSLITRNLGHDQWIKNLEMISGLRGMEEDPGFLQEFKTIKRLKKIQLAKEIEEKEGVIIDPNSLFDIQIKRLHEYKRQLLSALHIMDLYYQIKDGNTEDFTPRTFIFGAKSAPGYRRAKGIISYILQMARLINEDPDTKGLLKVVFVTNYNVSYAQKLFPAADISEQISTAGKEASGTGNMKFMLNGAVTLGTMDGATVEIVEEAGLDNNIIFGLSAQEIADMKDYNPYHYYETTPGLKRVVDSLIDGTFNDKDGVLREIHDSLIHNNGWEGPDQYFILADYAGYREAQKIASRLYKDQDEFAKMAIRNMYSAGKFSSDRSVKDYVENIWHIDSLTR